MKTAYNCPKCGDSDSISVEIQIFARITHDTDTGKFDGLDPDEITGDFEPEPDSHTLCTNCGHSATLDEFMNEDFSDEPDEQEQPEPDEDSLVTRNGTAFYQYGKPVLVIGADCTRAERNAAIRAYMAREQFWPNVFEISDHGNAILLKHWEAQ